VDTSGNFTTGAVNYYPITTFLNLPLTYLFQINGMALPNLLATNDTRWLFYETYSARDVVEAGIANEDTDWNSYLTLSMPGNVRNWFGLLYLSANVVYTDYNNGSSLATNILYPGAPLTFTGDNIWAVGGNQTIYPETAQPQFQTVEYDFWNPNWTWDPSSETGIAPILPGASNFSPTNTSQQFFNSPGQQIQIAGYAKLAVTNGYPGVYAYLGQYFDQAYTEDANGNVMTNKTGIVSPYGNFFATEPGPAALVTMPDVDTGARGVCTVNCISANVDKNDDGAMDLSWNDPDATSQTSPYRVWVNNGRTIPGTGGNLDQDLPVPPASPNYSQGKITCQRDLENFFRLWICGVPQLPVGQGYAVTMSMSPSSGNPAINLYYSCETNGGMGYLTNTDVAATQTGSAYYANALCTISNGQSCMLQMDSYGNTIAQTGVWLDLRDVKSLYQRVKVTPRDPNGIPGPWTSATTTFDENTADVDITSDGYGFSPPADESKTVTVFVHGSNLSVPSAWSNGDTMFKRLYWQGYHGRFVLFYWNTLVGPLDGEIPAHYNYNEFRAFKYGLALKKYVENDLPAGYAKNVIGHSLGNMVVASALYPRGSTPGMTCRNVIFMQAAVPASCFDSGAATYSDLATLENPQTTPDDYATQWGYRGLVATNINATLYNIYNAKDYALGWWIWNQQNDKPEDMGKVLIHGTETEVGTKYEWTFSSGIGFGTLYYANGLLHRSVIDPQESMAMIARSRTEAVGRVATGGSVGNNFDVGEGTAVNLSDKRPDHSGEFTRPIQQLSPFYNYLYLRIR
jgi:hypothetical protein